jgi:ornithine cyclodeaminase/alanine dehydrogenase-like protein (mu-crystallin family)
MKLLALSGAEVHELLGYGECVSAMRTALAGLARGQADQPLRAMVAMAAAPGLMGLMPAYLPGPPADRPGAAPGDRPDGRPGAEPGRAAYGLKAITITPANPAAGLDTHQGLVLLSDGQTGEPLAVLNASAVTEIRTAAVSVLATDVLGQARAGDLAVIGTGVQARSHVLAFSQTRALRRIRVAGRTPARAQAFAADLGRQGGLPVTACASARDAVDGADIIVTATSSAEPVLRRDWITVGAHINAVGACLPRVRELDTATVAAAALFADSRESLVHEAGDYLLARAEQPAAVGPDHFRGELGQVLTGAAAGRAGDTEITLFESLGLAIEDLAAGLVAYQNAAATGAGQWVDF